MHDDDAANHMANLVGLHSIELKHTLLVCALIIIIIGSVAGCMLPFIITTTSWGQDII
jgi:hypothetical protein